MLVMDAWTPVGDLCAIANYQACNTGRNPRVKERPEPFDGSTKPAAVDVFIGHEIEDRVSDIRSFLWPVILM